MVVALKGVAGAGLTWASAVTGPSAKVRLAWVAAVYLVAAMVLAGWSTHLRWVIRAMEPGLGDPAFGFRALALAGGLGALVWGIAAHFFPVRRLLVILAALSLPAVGWGWLLDDPEGGALLLSLVRGGLISLPWVLMAESLPSRHFAKLAPAITLAGLLGSPLGPTYWGLALDIWGVGSFLWIVLAEAGVLMGVVVALRPKVPRTGT